MKLFVDSNYLSPYAMSVFVALREKQLPFETVLVNLERQEQSDPLYAEVSTTRRVPAISDDGFHLSLNGPREGELQASEKLMQAAEMLGRQSGAMQLRYMQTLGSIAGDKSSTIVFPMPMELLKGWMDK